MSPRESFVAGARAFSPIMLGVLPFALVSGVAAVSVGLSIPTALIMSLVVYAGSAQLVAMQLLSDHTPEALIIVTTLIVNMRFLMYSASLAPYFRDLPSPWKWLNAFILTDQGYAVSISHFTAHPEEPHKMWYYLGASTTMWCTWQAGTVAGVFLGAQVPASWQLDFTIPLAFIALAVPAIRNRRFGAVGATAGLVAALTAMLPYKLGLVPSVIIGLAVGLALEARAK